MLRRLFEPRAETVAGRQLYAAVTAKARDPALYLDGGVPDTNEGRFELYTLHLALVLRRLRGQGREAQDVSQALFDTYVRSLDDSLREMGVGDLSVGKKMRKLGEAFYGRVKHYDDALAGGDREALRALIGRTVYRGAEAPAAGRLTAYVERADEALAGAPLADVLAARLPWPEFAA
jgi:cytochrome b pre-mRNA-processing protein 3